MSKNIINFLLAICFFITTAIRIEAMHRPQSHNTQTQKCNKLVMVFDEIGVENKTNWSALPGLLILLNEQPAPFLVSSHLIHHSFNHTPFKIIQPLINKLLNNWDVYDCQRKNDPGIFSTTSATNLSL